MKIYLIGIKGSGMSALANILLDDGYEVRGSDTEKFMHSETQLRGRNVVIDVLESSEYLSSDIVVVGHTFYTPERIEELNAHKKAFFEYNEFLGLYLDSEKLVSVCGSHGKTTLVKLLVTAFPDCSYLIGDGQGCKKEKDAFFFLESCEYKRHFLQYHPSEILLTNIDYDHIDYFKNEEDYHQAFQEFADQGKKIYCSFSCRNQIEHPNKITYGLDRDADYHLEYSVEKDRYQLAFFRKERQIHEFSFRKSADRFLESVAAVLSFYAEHNFDLKPITDRLSHFAMPYQRFNTEVYHRQILISDYCHHPSQIVYNLEQCRLFYPDYRKVAVFRPDRTSRLVYFKDRFVRALSDYDLAFVLPLSPTEEVGQHGSFELSAPGIVCLNQIAEIRHYLDEKEKYAFSFMSSKDQSEEIRKLKQLLSLWS